MAVNNTTYELLKAYASTRYTLTVAGTIDQLTAWYIRHEGIRVPERTFKRHARQLKDAGLIDVKHARARTYYTLLDYEVEMPKVKFLPASDPGRFDIVDDGTETVSYSSLLGELDRGLFNHNEDPADGEPEHCRAIKALKGVSLPF